MGSSSNKWKEAAPNKTQEHKNGANKLSPAFSRTTSNKQEHEPTQVNKWVRYSARFSQKWNLLLLENTKKLSLVVRNLETLLVLLTGQF